MKAQGDFSLESYNYELPAELVASAPANPRDSSRLFIYDHTRDAVTFETFKNLSAHIPHNALVIVNQTKVVPARVMLKKDTGGKCEVLFLVNEYVSGAREIKGFVSHKVTVGQTLVFPDGVHSITAIAQEEHIFTFELNFAAEKLFELLDVHGQMPLPQYIETGLSEAEIRQVYQPIFAQKAASIAAPTASLHFTEQVFADLKTVGVTIAPILLHVGRGTFAPVTQEHIERKKLHTEYYEIPAATIAQIREAKEQGRPVIAVGTTVVRALESAAEKILGADAAGNDDIKATTDIFIYPPQQFKIVDGLITNFHLPKSSLMCLVDAFLAYKQSKRGIVSLYNQAITERFRFYSFGDAMLILP